MSWTPYNERVFENKKIIEHGGWYCNVCNSYLSEDLVDEEFGCGRCSLDDWDEARTVIQVRIDNK